MITIPNVAFIITPNLKSATLEDNITNFYFNTFWQPNVDEPYWIILNITLKSISVIDKIKINESSSFK